MTSELLSPCLLSEASARAAPSFCLLAGAGLPRAAERSPAAPPNAAYITAVGDTFGHKRKASFKISGLSNTVRFTSH